MRSLLRVTFGAHAQIVVGVLMVVVTVVQTAYWTKIKPPPTTEAVFYVSMEALLFAGYGVIATGLGYRAAERIEEVVTPGGVAVEAVVVEELNVTPDKDD